MKTSLLALAIASLAGMLLAAETNLYLNPQYTVDRKLTEQRKKLSIGKHWYAGEISFDGDYKGAPAVKLQPVPAEWGGFHVALGVNQELKPGKYTFSVRCKLKGRKKPSYVYMYHTFCPAGQEKPVRKEKAYKGSVFPSGKWTELVMTVEVKPGDTRSSFSYDVYSSPARGPEAVWFADPKIIPEEK